MRPLTGDAEGGGGTDIAEGVLPHSNVSRISYYHTTLEYLKSKYHARCLFNNRSAFVPNFQGAFDQSGVLHGEFTGAVHHQGYDGRIHGGVLSAIIDASMAQCLMGHGVCGYTTELNIKYRKPVKILIAAKLRTWITEVNIGCLYGLKCEIYQDKKRAIGATGRFFVEQRKNCKKNDSAFTEV